MNVSSEAVAALAAATHGDPFSVLGPHRSARGWLVRSFRPDARAMALIDESGATLAAAEPLGDGLFEAEIAGETLLGYRWRAEGADGAWTFDDPFAFGPILGELDAWLFGEGAHADLHEKLGAHLDRVVDVAGRELEGVRFALWAPNASRAAVVGDFNNWDGRLHPMRNRAPSGVFELFVPGVASGARYKFELRGRDGAMLPLKADPFARASELRPNTASVVAAPSAHAWADGAWMENRGATVALNAPISIIEVHAGSWRKRGDGGFLSWDELADQLVPYARSMNYSHIQFLPISEHPFDGSWGYQPIGLFAPTARHGSPDGLRRFVDRAHEAGLGVMMDWVPGHFPSDEHGLGRFDGTALFEHDDPRQGFHLDWNTLIYNYGRREVANFLHANALYWLNEFHLDGLRVDAVASMLYLDYSRPEGEWIPNAFGGNENLEAIAFLKRANELIYGAQPGIATIAEESTAWPAVTKPTWLGGLGFGYKWNMGWMNDTLDYMRRDPVHRRHHHHQLTFGLLYGFSENFVLPLSHDEVVHGKGSILDRMPGDAWRKFANLRAYYGFMWAHPGKKLLFMGQEFAQGAEWSAAGSLHWDLLKLHWHSGVQRLVRDLNALYRDVPALHVKDADPGGFQWIDADDADHSLYSWLRLGEEDDPPVAIVANMTPVPRRVRIGLPEGGWWREIINTDSAFYGGSDLGNGGGARAEEIAQHGRPWSIEITAPPLATVYFLLDK